MWLKRKSTGPGDASTRTLLFHIGHHKTGSTSLQEAFATGSVKLKDKKIYYPGRLAHNYLWAQFSTYLKTGKAPVGEADYPGLEQISAHLAKGRYDVAILSGEAFEDAEPKKVRKVLDHFMLPYVAEHAVICYVRPHAARVMSSFAEQMKLGLITETPDVYFEKSLKEGRFIFADKLAGWSSVFQTNFKLRPLIRSQLSGGSVIQDFLETGLGPGCTIDRSAERASNESLCVEDLLIVRLIQQRLKDRNNKLRHALGWELGLAFASQARASGTGTRLKIHKSLAERVRSAYQSDARALDTTFFGGARLMRDELDRAVDDALPKPQPLELEHYLNPEAIRALDVLASQIDAMLDHKNEPWSKFLWESRIARLHDRR